MRPSPIILMLALAAAPACNRPEPPDTRTMLRKSLHGVLVYPRSTLVDATSGADAAQVTAAVDYSAGQRGRARLDVYRHRRRRVG